MSDKIKDIVVTIVFLITIISLFLINIIKKDTDISIAERRKVQLNITGAFAPGYIATCILWVAFLLKGG